MAADGNVVSNRTTSHNGDASSKGKGKSEERVSWASRAVQYVLERQIELPLACLSATAFLHVLSSPELLSFLLSPPGSHHAPPRSSWAPATGGLGALSPPADLIGRLHALTTGCFFLSYPIARPETATMTTTTETMYGKGPLDAAFVVTWILFFTFLRSATMRWLLSPIARRWMDWNQFRSEPTTTPAVSVSDEKRTGAGADGKQGQAAADGEDWRTHAKVQKMRDRAVTRFAEQGWSFLYSSMSWTFGMYIMSKTEYWPLKTKHFWIGYPYIELDGLTKFYYLAQMAFWFQQFFVLNIEARRADFLQMLIHHFITTALIAGSYLINCSRIGNVILCLMDNSDILLSLAKMLRYLGLQLLCDATFGLFMLSWLINRQILFDIVLYSVFFESHLVDFDAYSPRDGHYLSRPILAFFAVLLCALQVLLLIWGTMIVRVAYKVLSGGGAEDSRSDEDVGTVETEAEAEGEEERGEEEDVTANGQANGMSTATLLSSSSSLTSAVDDKQLDRESARRRSPRLEQSDSD